MGKKKDLGGAPGAGRKRSRSSEGAFGHLGEAGPEVEGQVFRSLADHSQEFIGICDLEFKPFYVNEAGIKLVGLESLEEACGVRVQDYFFPEDQRVITEEFFPKVLREGQGEVEIRFRHFKTGAAVWVIYNVFQVRDGEGRVTGYATVSRDITERKRAEEAVRSAALFPEENPFPVLRASAEGRLLFANRASADLLREWRCEVGSEVPEQVKETISTALESGRAGELELAVAGRILSFVAMPIPGGGYVNLYGRDVTEGKRAEAALRESNERLHRVLEVETVGVMFWDLSTGQMTDANDTFLRMMGYSRREVEAGELSWQKLTPPEYMEVSLAEIRKFMVTGRVGPYEKEYFRKDGTRQWLVFAGSSLGRNACVEFCVDITERKQAEAALSEANQRLSYHVQNTPLAVIEFDAELRVRAWSDGAQRIFGWEAAEVLGRPMWEIPWVCEEDRGKVEKVSHGLVGGATPRSVSPNRNLRKDGKVIWCEWYNSSLADAAGRMQSIQSLVLDVTERKRAEEALRESEERFRVAQELSPDGFTILRPLRDEAGRVVDFTWVYENAAIARMNGTDPQAVVGRRLLEVFPSHRGTGILRAFQEVAETGERHVFEALYSAETVAPTWFRLAVVLLGGDIAVLGQDITRQKEFEAELQRLVAERTAKLQELVGELEHVSYTITHDMRAPLRAMRAFAEMLKDEGEALGDEGRSFVGRIITGAERMDGLITDALNYTKTVRTELPVGPVDVGRLLRGMLDTYPQFQTGQADIVLERNLPMVIGNEAGLTQCFSNLLDNAVKFVRPGERPHVRVRADGEVQSAECRMQSGRPEAGREVQSAEWRVKNEGPEAGREMPSGWARIWVEDNGVGISQELMPRVFDMFSRGSSPQAGTGIGLALVRKVVERMGGRVGVESEPGRGSRFWVELKAAGHEPHFGGSGEPERQD